MRYLLILFLTGCLSAKKAGRQLDRISEEHPDLIASTCAKQYPCLPKKSDTISLVEYDFIEIECPDGSVPATSKDSTDTIYIIKQGSRIIKEVKIPCESKVITQYVEDSAKVRELRDKLGVCSKDFEKAAAEAKRYKGYTKVLGLLVLLIIVAYFVGRWFKRR